VTTRSRSAGFTLAEMIVSVAVLAVVSMYLTDMLVRQNRAYTVVDQVTEVQQNLRAIADLMERELRVTGFMVQEGAAFCGVDNTNGPDVVFVTDSDAISPANQTQLDIGADVIAGSAGTNLTVDDTTVDGVPFYDNTNDGVADADFLANATLGTRGGVILFDRNNPGGGTSCGMVTSVPNGTTVNVDWNVTVNGVALVPAPTLIPGGPGTDLVAIPAHWYAILPAAAGGSPQLFRDGTLLADDVEDLQFALFYDVNGDGLVTGNVAGAGQPPRSATEYPGSANPGVPYVSSVWDNTLLREIRLNFVVRTRSQDADVLQNPDGAQGTQQALENRVPPVGADGFRRRVHSMTVRPRNVGLRPVET
jgi:prepilin-type N-terminal cleavage/methylation domain-containing protein